MQYALYLPNFGAEHSARGLAELAREAEEAGWDGFFLWDHVNRRSARHAACWMSGWRWQPWP